MSRATKWIVAVDDPTAKTLLQSIFAEVSSAEPEFVRRDGRNRQIMLVERNGAGNGVLYTDAEFDDASVIEVAIGASNTPPTTGDFGLSFNGDDTGLTALDFNITDTALATALNANPAITTAGGVTVSKGTTNGQYLVSFDDDGAQNLLVITAGTLSPPSTVNVERVQVGGASTNEVQRISFKQGYLAYSDDFAASAAGTLSVTVTQTGSATQPSIQTIVMSDNAVAGTWTLQASQAQICKLTCLANSGSQPGIWRFTLTGNTIVSGDYVDLQDDVGPVRVWFNIAGTGVAPSTPVGGRLVEIAAAGTTEAVLGSALWTAFSADSGIEQNGTTFGYSFVQVQTIAHGYYDALVVPPFMTMTQPSRGSMGRLDGSVFVLSDAEGTVGVWVNLSDQTEIPSGISNVNRVIQVTTIAADATAAQVATAIATVLDADAQFAAVAASNVVTITDSQAGERALPVQSSPFLGIVRTAGGYTIAGSFPVDATAGDLQNIFGDYYRVTKPADFVWQLVALENGVNATAVASDTNLEFAAVFNGTLVLNTWNMALAFDATAQDTISSTLEIQVTEPGGQPVKVLNIPCTIRRDVIEGAGIPPPSASNDIGNVHFLTAVTGYDGGGVTNLDGVTTTVMGVPRLCSFVHTTEGLRGYLLRAGTDAESLYAIIRPDDYDGTTNAKVWQSVF